MSLIRKPVAAEQEGSLRRAAEATIVGAKVVRDAGREAGTRAGRGFGKILQVWLLVSFTFGALTASSFGAKVLGMMIMAPFWYFALRKRNGGEKPKPSETAHELMPDRNRLSVSDQVSLSQRRDSQAVLAGFESFDPDAAIARHLEKKAAEAPSGRPSVPTPSRSHGRTFGQRVA